MDPVLERRAVLDQVEAKAGELALLADPRIGQPDRRHQVALGEHRQHHRVDPVGLAGQRRQALDLLGVGDLDRPSPPARGCRGRSGRRSSTRSPRRPARAWTSSIRRASVLSESTSGGTASWSRCSPWSESRQTSSLLSTEIESGVQHLSGPPWCSLLGDAGACHRGGPSSWQSKAATPTARRLRPCTSCPRSVRGGRRTNRPPGATLRLPPQSSTRSGSPPGGSDWTRPHQLSVRELRQRHGAPCLVLVVVNDHDAQGRRCGRSRFRYWFSSFPRASLAG